MWGHEVPMSWCISEFIDLDYYEAEQKRGDAKQVNQEVGDSASTFLRSSMCWLENEGGLSYEEEAGLGLSVRWSKRTKRGELY